MKNKSKKQSRREAILQELEARYKGVTVGSLIRNFARLQNWLMKEWLRNGTEKVAGLETNRAYLKKYHKDEYESTVLGMMRNVRNKESIFDHASKFPKNLGVDFLYNEITRYREKQAIQNHSPYGFSWGYIGSGCAQLALALLLHELNDKELAQRFYQQFNSHFVAALPFGENFEHILCLAHYFDAVIKLDDL